MSPIINTIRKHQSFIQEEFSLLHLFVYGSYAIGQQNHESDLDLIYELTNGAQMTLGRLKRLENLLKDITQISEIELVNRKYMNPIVYEHAKREFIQLF